MPFLGVAVAISHLMVTVEIINSMLVGFHLLTEAGENILAESGDNLRTE